MLCQNSGGILWFYEDYQEIGLCIALPMKMESMESMESAGLQRPGGCTE